MIGKIVKGTSFAGCVNYLYKGEGKARLIDSCGSRSPIEAIRYYQLQGSDLTESRN